MKSSSANCGEMCGSLSTSHTRSNNSGWTQLRTIQTIFAGNASAVSSGPSPIGCATASITSINQCWTTQSGVLSKRWKTIAVGVAKTCRTTWDTVSLATYNEEW